MSEGLARNRFNFQYSSGTGGSGGGGGSSTPQPGSTLYITSTTLNGTSVASVDWTSLPTTYSGFRVLVEDVKTDVMDAIWLRAGTNGTDSFTDVTYYVGTIVYAGASLSVTGASFTSGSEKSVTAYTDVFFTGTTANYLSHTFGQGVINEQFPTTGAVISNLRATTFKSGVRSPINALSVSAVSKNLTYGTYTLYGIV